MKMFPWVNSYIYYARFFFSWSTGLFTNYYYKWFSTKRIDDSPPITIVSETDKYAKRYTSRWMASFLVDDAKWNLNVDPAFFDKTLLAAALAPAQNELETRWRRRLLYETTPRGNIIMYYDPYKLGFAYYSDSASIPYSVLNAAAIKYCLTFACRDLFLDDEITSKKSPSPLILLHLTDLPPARSDAKPTSPDKNVFARFKNYGASSTNSVAKKNGQGSTTKTDPVPVPVPVPVPIYVRNRFICQGKIANMQFLQRSSVEKNTLGDFNSPMLDNLRGETKLQKEVMSYHEFKRKATERIE
jgi:hypothetical protein